MCTKATKVAEDYFLKLRDLRVLRGAILTFYFGCGAAALGAKQLNHF
jgi:hypothetical protein